jgi:hypothetical protein
VPNFDLKEPPYKPPKTLQLDWKDFKGGLNTLLRQTEIKDNELAQASNLKLVGLGVPTKREGTADYFLTAPSVATGAQRVRGLKGVLFSSGASGINELLALSDYGILVKKSGASYIEIPGASYASGYNAEMVQIFNNVYITNGINALTKYGGTTISPFVSISRPTGVAATNLSGVSGTFTRSFRVSAFNAVGETIASDSVLLANTPQDLTTTSVRITWTTSSPASLVLGYGVYGFDQGDERLITTVDASTTRYDYLGDPEPSQLVFPQAADTTGGPVAKYVITHKDKIVLGNIQNFPSRIAWSGGGSNVDKFNWRFGGGYIDIDKDTGDRITGLIEYQDSIVVFKERSVWQVTLSTQESLVIPTVKMIIRGVGCVSHRTIRHVENDVFFLSRRGVFTLGNEANYLANVLRTNELSAKIRPLFETLSPSQLEQACGIYHMNKYRLSYPTSGTSKNDSEVIYDRERLAWMGPNTPPAVPAVYETYFDGDNRENLVWGDTDDNFVTQFSSAFPNDKGVKIQTSLLSKKTAFQNPFRFKQVKNLYSNWRNVFGTPFVNIILETRDGAVGSAQSFTISASSAGVGWGFDKWGTFKWGTSAGAGSAEASNDLVRRTRVNKIGRTVQIEVTTTGNNDKYELLALQLQAQELGEGIIPSDWNTN